MTGAGLTTVINWSSLFLVSTANFIIPFILYLYSKRHREKLNKLPIIELEQQARLSREMSRSSISGHSRRNVSVSGSIRGRPTGSSLQSGTQSHLDLAIGPTTGIAAASIIPLSVGIGSSGVIHHSVSEENLNGESTRYGSRRRYHSHQNVSFGSSSASDIGEVVSGPYFSFYRDGEVFERESSSGHILEPSHPRSQSTSTMHRPSGSTVVLHDPGTERAQRKVLPRRVSHKDKILSMISDKHKRAVEKQTKMIQDERSVKPVPPMILLSQSTAPEPEDDDQSSSIDLGLYLQENESYESEKYSEKDDTGEAKDISEANSNLSAALKKLNRKSSIITALQQPNGRSILTLLPLSPPIRLTPPMMEIRGDSKPIIQHLERLEQHILEPSPTFSPPRSPSSPRSALRLSPSSSPGRSSPRGSQEVPTSRSTASPGFGINRDSLKPDATLTDTTRLSPGAGSTSSSGGLTSAFNFQLHHSPSPSTPDSSGSVYSPDRRVSFSDESRAVVSPTELERKASFGDESRRSGRTLASTFLGGSGRSGTSPGASPGSRDARVPFHEWKAPLLENHEEVDENEREDETDLRDETLGPELFLAKTEQSQTPSSGLASGSGSDPDGQRSEARRGSLGRMAAAFVAQPGAFSILTAPVGSSLVLGNAGEERDATSVQVPTLTITAQDTVDRLQGLKPTQGGAIHSVTVPSLSPSGPPTFLSGQGAGKRSHGRTVSASAEILDRSPRSQRSAFRAQSTQSLKEIHQQQDRLAAPGSANSLSIHLTPPSPSLLPNAQLEATNPHSDEARDSVTPLASPAAQPSPQPRAPLHHRNSFNGRNNHRHSVVAPFQGGNNYSIPGFSPHPQTSPQHPPSPGSNSVLDQGSTSAQGLGSSWFSRRPHSRDPSRSTMASFGMAHSASSTPLSSLPTPSELTTIGGLGVGLGASVVAGAGKQPEKHYFPDSTTIGSLTIAAHHTTATSTTVTGTTVADAAAVAEFERAEGRLHESSFHLPLYSIGFDARWSLRAIPDWFPMSSTKVAWTSLTILVLAIGSTIVYDFIQLARGNDLIGGS